ncbi:hypothetical protein BBK36DRAFT_1113756 [Trichoderma citrinoviride]|uniref:GDS1 winged helix domain-containing protein n=1 Tax=Trichoderma citrinoviride TaxID=58853 RepID=A0A2T4BIE6_9HYPO|nr:hypothetical protein BBK36DRAFT_1113756 [Trichoderma citrinoviride]PTB69092.1 hypothetical protein BBK36DRAFT_1113756 [Trichoderma citrinoviride]
MPYNTRRKSLSLPSLGIHIPVTHASRAAASKSNSRAASASSASATPASSSASRSESPEAHPNKRAKRSHTATDSSSSSSSSPSMAIENTPPPSPTRAISEEMPDADAAHKIDLESIKDDIVEAVVVQLQTTGNRPHLIKELATVLAQSLTSVQQSANQCAIISSRLASYMKRPCWSASNPCPLAKELETVHPRRTYYFLTTQPRQELPDFNASLQAASVTPSVSLTEDSGSEDIEARRRELSPSPEVDLSATEYDNADDDVAMPMTPIGSFSSHRRLVLGPRNNSPPLEKDEREFTQTAGHLQKRKLNAEAPQPETVERQSVADLYRDDAWFADSRPNAATIFLASPSIKPSISAGRKEDDADAWLRLNNLFEWGKGAESIEIDELDYLLDAC